MVVSQILLEVILAPKHSKYFTNLFRAVHLVFSAFICFRYVFIQLLIINQVFSCFLLYCRYLTAFILSAVTFYLDFLSFPAFFIALFYFHLHHMNMSIRTLNEFPKKCFNYPRWTIAEPSLTRNGRYVIVMAIDGAPRKIMTIGELH